MTGVCLVTWTMHNNTNVDDGVRVGSASTLVACLQACIDNTTCTGVDYARGSAADQRCWMSGPWSGDRNSGTTGVTHYEFRRDCRGSVSFLMNSASLNSYFRLRTVGMRRFYHNTICFPC